MRELARARPGAGKTALQESRTRRGSRTAGVGGLRRFGPALPEYEGQLRADADAWDYFQQARPSYRKQVTWWVISAKRQETRLRRLRILIESSAKGEVIPPMRWAEGKQRP